MNRKTQGVEKHAPEAVFDVYRSSGYAVKDRTKRGSWGSPSTKNQVLSPRPKMPGSLTADPCPKNPIEKREVYGNVSK